MKHKSMFQIDFEIHSPYGIRITATLLHNVFNAENI